MQTYLLHYSTTSADKIYAVLFSANKVQHCSVMRQTAITVHIKVKLVLMTKQWCMLHCASYITG
jgi:hypothetical protein